MKLVRRSRNLLLLTVLVLVCLAIGLTPYAIERYRLRGLTAEEMKAYHEWIQEYPEIQLDEVAVDPLSEDFLDQFQVMRAHFNLLERAPWNHFISAFMYHVGNEWSTDDASPRPLYRHPFDRLDQSIRDLVEHPEYSVENFQLAENHFARSTYYRRRINAFILNNIYYDLVHDDIDSALESYEIYLSLWEPSPGDFGVRTAFTVRIVTEMMKRIEENHPDRYEALQPEILFMLEQLQERIFYEELQNSYPASVMKWIIRFNHRLENFPEPLPADLDKLSAVQITACINHQDWENIRPWNRPVLFSRIKGLYMDEDRIKSNYRKNFIELDEMIEELHASNSH